MQTVLFIISLLLHGLTFLWILTLMQRIGKADQMMREAKQFRNEMEDILISYTTEMKEENERLVKHIQQSKVSTDLMKNKEPLEKGTNVEQPETKEVAKDYEEQYAEYSPPVDFKNSDQVLYEQSDTAKVMALAKQGYKKEEIAKKLKLGNGEVELMLKFYRGKQ